MRYSTFSVLFAAAAMAAVPEKPPMTNTTATPKHFAMLVFSGFQAIDVFGPLDVLNTLSMIYDPTMHVSIISATLDPVSTLPSPNQNMTMKHGDFGQCIVPTDTYKNVLGNDGKCGGSGEMSHMHAKRHEGHDHVAAPVASAVPGYPAAPMPSMSTVYGSAPAPASSATPIKYDTGAYSVSPVQYDTGAYSAAPVPYDTGAYSAAPLPSAASASSAALAPSAAPAPSEAHDMPMPSGSHAMMPVASMMPSMAMSEKGDIDVLMIPGGSGTRGLMDEEIAFVKAMYPKVKHVITVCTGATIAARAGILDGRNATTNKRSWTWAASTGPKVNWVPSARWVEDGNIWSSSGVSAGIDVTFAWVAKIYGKEVAQFIANSVEHEMWTDAQLDPFAKIWEVPGAI